MFNDPEGREEDVVDVGDEGLGEVDSAREDAVPQESGVKLQVDEGTIRETDSTVLRETVFVTENAGDVARWG